MGLGICIRVIAILIVISTATRAANKPTELLPALNMAGSEFNALGAAGVPLQNAKFAIVFHGLAINGILDDAHYRKKFGVSKEMCGISQRCSAMNQIGFSVVIQLRRSNRARFTGREYRRRVRSPRRLK